MTDQPTETTGIGSGDPVVVVVAATDVVVSCDVAGPDVVDEAKAPEVGLELGVHAPINATSASAMGLSLTAKPYDWHWTSTRGRRPGAGLHPLRRRYLI